MKKKLLITNFDMEIGGVERSLLSLLDNIDYDKHCISVHLHSHAGPLMPLINSNVSLLEEKAICNTFRASIKQVFGNGYFILSAKRLLAKVSAKIFQFKENVSEPGAYQLQKIWDYCVDDSEKIKGDFDVAISYHWPHHFTAYNVTAKKKIAWIHTDYSYINLDKDNDLKVWKQFDYIVSISDCCTEAFLSVYPSLKNKTILVENLANPDYVKEMAKASKEIEFNKGFNLVSVGRLCNAKGFDRAVEVLAELDNRGRKDINWYIVGEGGDRALIESKIEEHKLQNRFILLGSTTNPYPYMKAADVYLQPSRYEGKAVTVGEALILAKPTIITNYRTASSQINNGVNGMICEESVSAIADAIEELYNSPQKRKLYEGHNENTNHKNIEELNKLYTAINS